MNVERTGGLGGPGAPDGGQHLSRPGSKSGGVNKPAGDPDVQTPSGVDFVRLVAKAPDVNQAAVAEARRLLDSGQLSTADAVRRAAESILRRGI